jgi:hypothetical protein
MQEETPQKHTTRRPSRLKIADNSTIDGDLNLLGFKGLTELPENLVIRGSLNLIGCSRITKLPERLHIDRDLIIVGLSLDVPSGVVVGGKIYR